jgi:hypothetical protein
MERNELAKLKWMKRANERHIRQMRKQLPPGYVFPWERQPSRIAGFLAGLLGALFAVGCATPSTPADVSKPPVPAKLTVPACTFDNLLAYLDVADGTRLRCVEAEGPPSPRWEAIK